MRKLLMSIAVVTALSIPRAPEAQDAPAPTVKRPVAVVLRVESPSDVPGPGALDRHPAAFDTAIAPNGASPAKPIVALSSRNGVVGVVSKSVSGRSDSLKPRIVIQAPRPISSDPWWAPLSSAAVPGAGQAQLGQDRFVGYLAIEGFLWLRYLTDRREALRQRDAFRNVALRVSRAPYGGPKPSGDFEYYERMEHWIASGVYDVDPLTPGLDPETDTTTFNGAMWLLARRTYWPRSDTPPAPGSPAYLAALGFYEQSAVRPDFQWSWRAARLEQDIYRRHIKESNDAYRRAIQDVSIVIANHVLSTVDAYISLRLRMRAQLEPGGHSSVGIFATLPVSQLGGAPK